MLSELKHAVIANALSAGNGKGYGAGHRLIILAFSLLIPVLDNNKVNRKVKYVLL